MKVEIFDFAVNLAVVAVVLLVLVGTLFFSKVDTAQNRGFPGVLWAVLGIACYIAAFSVAVGVIVS